MKRTITKIQQGVKMKRTIIKIPRRVKMKRTITKIITITLITSSFAITSLYAIGNDSEVNNQIKELQQKVASLEQALSQKNKCNTQKKTKNRNNVTYNRYRNNPFSNLRLMQKLLNDDSMFLRDKASSMDQRLNIDTDIKESKDKYIISMDIPGMDKGKINLEVKGDNLIISGKKNNEIEEKNADNHYFHQERTFGAFSKSLRLPKNGDQNNINATYKDGVLTVSINKLKINKPQQKKITIN